MAYSHDWLMLAVAVVLPVAGGFVGALATKNEVQTWYTTIRKPAWTPPNWLFGPVWTVLYMSMGLASWLVWLHGGFAAQSVPLAWYVVNLVLNFSWTPLFFIMHRPDLALLDILAMLAVEGVMLLEFAQIIGWQVALLLLLPYAVWTSYATALNAWIWWHNPDASASDRTPLLPSAS